MLLDDIANELVSATSELVGGRTINIMNPDGIIIASTEKERIGSLHQGALEAARTGRTVIVSKGQLSQYLGAKEGYNMPLRVCGRIIGVVGLHGNPEEIQDLAHLLEVYATKYYQLEAMARPRLAEIEYRACLLRYLLSPTESSISNATALMETRNIRLSLPVVVAVLSPDGELPEGGDAVVEYLIQGRYLSRERDVWGVVDNSLVILFSGGHPPLAAALQAVDSPEARWLKDFRISFSAPRDSFWDIHVAYQQAALLNAASPHPINDMQRVQTCCDYIFYHTALTETAFIDGLYQRLCGAFPPSDRRELLLTAQAYYQYGRSVTTAAGKLFIHKNTLQYRIRRLEEALGLTGCTDFQQEFLIRLLLEYYKHKQGLRTLE